MVYKVSGGKGLSAIDTSRHLASHSSQIANLVSSPTVKNSQIMDIFLLEFVWWEKSLANSVLKRFGEGKFGE